MQATVVEIKHPNDHLSPNIKVRVRRSSTTQGLFTFRKAYLYDQLKVGDTIEVKRQTNNPYLVLVE